MLQIELESAVDELRRKNLELQRQCEELKRTDLRAIVLEGGTLDGFSNEALRKVKVPVLIGQGEEDDHVPVSQGHRMVNALAKAGANMTYVFYKKSEHDFGSSADLQDWLAHLDAFLAKYTPS